MRDSGRATPKILSRQATPSADKLPHNVGPALTRVATYYVIVVECTPLVGCVRNPLGGL